MKLSRPDLQLSSGHPQYVARACLFSAAVTVVTLTSRIPYALTHGSTSAQALTASKVIFTQLVFINLLPDYLSLLKTRHFIQTLVRAASVWQRIFMVLIDVALSFVLAAFAFGIYVFQLPFFFELTTFKSIPRVGPLLYSAFQFIVHPSRWTLANWISVGIPAFAASIWLWLYALSGFLLRAARRFDIGFQWFNRKVDIEKHPLSSIGLVAGSLVALAYWGFAAVAHFVR
jgi:hypothetical protein